MSVFDLCSLGFGGAEGVERVCTESTRKGSTCCAGSTPLPLPPQPPAKAIMTPQGSAGEHARSINLFTSAPNRNLQRSDGPADARSGRDYLSERCLFSPPPHCRSCVAPLANQGTGGRSLRAAVPSRGEVTHCHAVHCVLFRQGRFLNVYFRRLTLGLSDAAGRAALLRKHIFKKQFICRNRCVFCLRQTVL